MKRFGALFDLDGVLIDSEGRYTEFWDGIERIYPTGIPDYARAIKGTTLETIMENYDDPDVRYDITERLHRFQQEMPFELYDGVERFLDSLSAEKVPMAIVTSSDPVKMEQLRNRLPGFVERFDVVIDGGMVIHSKPDPEGYCLAAKKIEMPSECCIVFEDSIQGLHAGRAAGGKVVAIATTWPRATVSPFADLTVDRLAELTPERLVELFS